MRCLTISLAEICIDETFLGIAEGGTEHRVGDLLAPLETAEGFHDEDTHGAFPRLQI